jgi:hypothetical protein
VVEKKGRKTFSRGLWAPTLTIESARTALTQERDSEGYAKKLAGARARREKTQVAYAATFEEEVHAFLRFAPNFADLAHAMARAIALHATPVGSGTVARTKRIPVAQRAEAATIAWMRHKTTAYDNMHIARIKGERREVRRELAQVSRALLDQHRRENVHSATECALCKQKIEAALATQRPCGELEVFETGR